MPIQRTAATTPDADALLLTLVDLPGMPAAVAQRIVDAGPIDAATLRRAVIDDRPTHPVLIGRSHWAGVAELASGDIVLCRVNGSQYLHLVKATQGEHSVRP